MREEKREVAKRPDICLSLCCATMEEFEIEIQDYKEHCQLVEWNVDKMIGSAKYEKEEFIEKLKQVKKLCQGKKLIVNYAGSEIVGNRIRRWAMGHTDIIDIDINNSQIKKLIREAKIKRTKTLISQHISGKMVDKNEVATQFVKMEKTGGNILCIECFANSEEEGHHILQGASAYTQLKRNKPIIAIAMGEEGQASRICAGDFGSILTYCCGSKPDAPGQINAKDMNKYLDIYYERR